MPITTVKIENARYILTLDPQRRIIRDGSIMIEGQDGLTWPRWKRLAEAAERLGYAGLFRSDHFTNSEAPPATLSILVPRGPVECQTPHTTPPPATASADHGQETPHGP